MKTIETRPHVRLAADWTADPDVLSIDPLDRALAVYVYHGYLAASRRDEAFGSVRKAKKVLRAILAGISGDPDHLISVLVEADLAEYDAAADILNLTQWAEWQQTEEEVTVGQQRRSAKAKAAADKRWAAERARTTTIETTGTSAVDAPSMLGACAENAQPCSDMQEEKQKRNELECEVEGEAAAAQNPPTPTTSVDTTGPAAALVDALWTDHAKQERHERGLPVLSRSQGESLLAAVVGMLADTSLPEWALREAVDGALRGGKSPAAYAKDVARKKAQEAASGPSASSTPARVSGRAAVPSLPGVTRAPSRVKTA
ncbi:hypothetical protein [Nocardioides bigeumensis]|uniref:DUF222 domain-containing protein n=1 Tax=Nocardioides bigeumensis TaxID=433657 RepID=A0ABP5KL55_9ACTN